MKNSLVLLLCGLISTSSFAQGTARKAPPPKEEKEEAPDLSQLTTEEIRIYDYGRISDASLIGGGLIGTFFGLGLGHIVYSEYTTKGWIFTVGELGTLAIASAGLTKGAVDCSLGNTRGCSGGLGLYTFGIMAFLGFRIWEVVDVWTLPSRHNQELRAIQRKLGEEPSYGVRWQVLPLLQPADAHHGSAYGLGLAARF